MLIIFERSIARYVVISTLRIIHRLELNERLLFVCAHA